MNRSQQRAQAKEAAKVAGKRSVIAKAIKEEYGNLTVLTVESYAKRLNDYLENRSHDMIKKIGYDKVDLHLVAGWQKPEPRVVEHVLKTRGKDLDPEKEVFFFSLRRQHLLKKQVVEEFSPWGGVFYPTEQMKTNTEVEISAFAAFLGYMTEKGIEYAEVEREHKKELYNEEALEKARKNVEEATQMIDDAIKTKENA